MGKKLLLLPIWFLIFLPISIWGQCPSSVGITSNQGNQICSETSVEFSASFTSGSYGTLTYNWEINGNSVGNGATYSSNTLQNGDVVQLILTSTETDGSVCSTNSDSIAMTVNQNRTGTVTIQASNTEICPNETIDFSIGSISNAGTNANYIWKVNNIAVQSGTNSNFSSTLSEGDIVSLDVEPSIPCTSNFSSNNINITEKAGIPAQPSGISGEVSVCPGVSKTYSVTSDPSASDYIWNLPSGWTGSSNTNSITVNTGTSSGNISVEAKNSCGTSTSQLLNVSVQAGIPATPGNITGETSVCPGISKTYSISTVTGASEYAWTLPPGWTGSSTSNSITVTTGSTGNDGNISVIAKNSCGESSAKNLAVNVKTGIPSQPSGITGSAAVCPSSSQTYSVTNISGVTYKWMLPTGWSGTSTTNSITVNTGTAGGTISVTANNDCGESISSTLAITMKPGTPATPGNFTSGPPTICPNTQATYTVPAVTGASEYIWTLPSGFSASSLTTTSPSLVVSALSSGSGNITVQAKNDCGISSAKSIAVSISNPAPVMSGTINGPSNVCAGGTNLSYSIPAIANATSYTWTFPGSGWSITAGSGTNSITVKAGTTSGNLTVTASNSCGTSTSTSFAVITTSGIPNQPGAITTNLTTSKICPPLNNVTFEVPGQTGLTYNWTLPSGFEITSGAGTRKITVKINANTAYASNLKVEVQAVNVCGSSSKRIYEPIAVDSYVLADLGEDKTVCPVTTPISINGFVKFGNGAGKLRVTSVTTTGSGTFQNLPDSNSNVNDFTFTYTPTTADINAGSVMLTLTTEKPGGACQAGQDEMTIFFRPLPTVTITANTPICAGNTSIVTFTGTPDTRVTYRMGTGPDQTIDLTSGGTASLTTAVLNTNTTYNLRSIQYISSPNCNVSGLTGSTTVNVTQLPTASISYSGPYCTSETALQPVNLTGTNAYTGGTFNKPSGLSIDDSGAINPSLSTPGEYTVTYTTLASGGCEPITTNTQVIIQKETLITSQPVNTRACAGDEISLEVIATGENLNYQWYFNSIAAGNEVTGGNSSTLILSGINNSQEGTYYVVVDNSETCTPVNSSPAELIVDEEIIVETQPINTTVCEGENSSLSISVTTGGNALDESFSYQWYKGTPGSGTLLTGMNSASIPFNNASVTDSGDYYVEITGSSNFTCQSVTSDVVEFVVRPSAVVEISGETTICEGGSAQISFLNGTPNTIVTYTINGDNTNPQTLNLDSSGESVLDTGILNATSGTDTTFEYKIISIAYADAPECSNSYSASTIITVAPNPAATLTFEGDQVEFCTKDGSRYIPNINGTGNYTGGTFSSDGLNIDSSNGSFIPSENSPGDYTISYTIPAYGGCPEEITSLEVSIYEEVLITSEPFNLAICSTQDAEFSVVASGDDLTYQWYKDGSPISGATAATLSLPVATSENAGEYYVLVSGTNACTPNEDSQVQSETVTLNVDEDIIILEPAADVEVCLTGDASAKFTFIAHANGAPLLFDWIYSDGTLVPIDGSKFVNEVNQQSNYNDSGIDVHIGTLTINNITEDDDASYAVRIDGSANNFSCPIAVSNSFNLDVNPLPDAPVVSTPIEYCLGATTTALTANGSNLTWFDSEGNELASAPTPSTETTGTTTYFVSQKDTFCESPQAQIEVVINALPSAPPVTDEELLVEYCLGETANPLTATSDIDHTVNWYNNETDTETITSNPIPQTTAAGDLFFWVSQMNNTTGCEGPRKKITVSIKRLPELIVPEEQTICSGDTVDINISDINDSDPASTTFSWDWEGNEGNPLTGSSQSLTPTVSTTYTVTATNEYECINTGSVIINVDDKPVGGTIEGTESVCITGTSINLNLVGSSGPIDRWEYQEAGSTDWIAITEENPDINYQLEDLSTERTYRAVLINGVCEEVYSETHTITVDPEPIAGNILFRGTDRVFTMCEFPTEDYLVPIQTTGTYVGEIVSWQYRRNSETVWTTIKDTDGSLFTGDVLSGQQVNAASNNESTLFRVEVGSGACSPTVFTDFATLSVIPSDIAPNPVTITRPEICIGDFIELSSGTGYGGYGTFIGGAFDNSSIANHGWRVMRFDDQTEYTFESAADNVRPDRWMRTNPHDYLMANPNGGGNNIYQRFDSCSCDEGNKGFAIVSGDNPSTLETPVFNLYATENPTLTFDQAYNLTHGDTIRVEISLDGGNTYTELPLMEIGGPSKPGDAPNVSTNYARFGDDGLGEPNNMSIDLSQYAGLGNLRIRWLYDGSTGGIYTIDDIGLPEDPENVQLIWYYDADPNDPNNDLEQIGEVNQGTVQYTPTKIGWNYFQVNTALVFDTNGDPCESAENQATIQVYVFDSYTTTATANVGSCGSAEVPLQGTLTGGTQGEVTEFFAEDTSTVAWTVISSPEGYTFSEDHFTTSGTEPAINDPQAVFLPPIEGDYTLEYTITPDERNTCTIINGSVSFTFIDCVTLDFDGVDDYIDLETNYTGNYFIEAWIRPFDRPLPDGSNTDATKGTIISGPGFEIKMDNLPASIVPNGRWYHIAVSNNGKLWVDGVESGTTSITGSTTNKTIIGARWNSTNKSTENHFSGWIEEVRIWNNTPLEHEIRFMMNQRLKLDETGTVSSPLEGEVVPNRSVAGSYLTDGSGNNLHLEADGTLKTFYDQTTSDLAGYYRLYSNNPDPLNLLPGYFADELKPSGGYTPDHSINKVPGRMYNITTDQENTSPTPYFSKSPGGTWANTNTWARPGVWDYPNSTYDGTAIDWNIARINHNITSDSKTITMLGLLSETESALLSINGNHFIRITHYLLLDGNMDLVDESQLLQDHGSILANSSKGWAEIDQQGRMSSFNYNYWTSPFSNQGSDNNSGFMLNQVLLDGTNPNTPQKIKFMDGYFVADGARTNPITISNEWIWDFRGGRNDDYSDWLHLGSDYTEIVGAGYSMKGTDGTAGLEAKQNYVFRGKPNNGNIPTADLNIVSGRDFLVGNPYPSAIDAEAFLKDNLINVGTGSGNNENGENVFNGALYYWDHFGGQTHILAEYIGGYATYTLAGSTPAISNDWRINANDAITDNPLPQRYIPVAQGFFLSTVGGSSFGGDIIFKNTQRIYITEDPERSIFLQHEDDQVKSKSEKQKTPLTDTRVKIRLRFESPKKYYRQILVTMDQNTTNGFDLGYDAPLIENNMEDMYWYFDEKPYVIQGVPDFEKEQILPLAIKSKEGGEFTIKIDKTENWPSGKELYLKDKSLDTIHNILAEAYVSSTETGGEINDRFELVFYKEQAQIPDTIDPTDLPEIDGLVGISYSTFTKQVKISNFDLLDVSKVMIFDMGGKLIQEYDDLPTEKEILLGMRPVRAGVYIIKVFSENGISDKKVVIK